jgi:hypothetical protein
MSEKDAHALIEHASRFAEHAIKKYGVVTPIYHMITADCQNIVAPSPGRTKDEAVAMMRALFELRDVVRYVYLDEAWILDRINSGPDAIPPGELERLKREGVSKHPDRVEVVMFSCEDRDAGQIMALREIIRNGSGKPRLGPLRYTPRSGYTEGRMVGLLPVRGTRQ